MSHFPTRRLRYPLGWLNAYFPTGFDNSPKLINPAPHRRSDLRALELRFQWATAVLACEKQRTLVRGALLDDMEQHFAGGSTQVRLAAEIESGELKIDDESKEAAWVPLSSAVELPLAESQRRRLKDVVDYGKEWRTFLK